MTDLIWSCPKCGGSNESVRVVSGKSKFWSKRMLVPLTAMVIFSSLLPQQVASSIQTASISKDGLQVKVYPVYAPDIKNDKDCTEGSIGVSRIDGLAFSKRDAFTVESFSSEGGAGATPHLQNGIRDLDGFPSYARTKIVLIYPFAKELPKTVALNFDVCSFDFTSWGIYKVPTKLDVTVRYFKDLTSVAAEITVPVQIYPRDAEATLISELRKACGQNWTRKSFTYNMTVEQSGSPKKNGDSVRIAGTLFRHGFPSPNDEIGLFLESKGLSAPREFVMKVVTDEKGQFEFKFPIVRQKNSKTTEYVIVAYNRAEPIGPISGPFDEMAYSVIFQWGPTAKYYQDFSDWVPGHTKACKERIDSYSNLVSTGQAKIFSDDRNRLLWFTAKSVYYGFKGKQSYSSTSQWSSKSGGRCYVSGYTTSSGKRVSGYYRKCP